LTRCPPTSQRALTGVCLQLPESIRPSPTKAFSHARPSSRHCFEKISAAQVHLSHSSRQFQVTGLDDTPDSPTEP
jgi:hypothetical protein